MERRSETLPGFDVAGFQIRTSNAKAMETIGPLWGRVHAEGLGAAGAGVGPARLYAVYSNYESDHNGEYDFTIGKGVDSGADIPDGQTHLRVPDAKYAVVTAKGEMPGALIETWMKIWEANLPRAFGADFEIHDPATPGEVEIWLSVKD